MTNLLKEPNADKVSLSRVIVLGGFLVPITMWIVTMIVIFASDRTWDQFSGALDWGWKFFGATTLPYLGNLIGNGIGNIGKRIEKEA